MTQRIGIALCGCGYWGEIVLKNLLQIEAVEVKLVLDVDENRLMVLQQNYPNIIFGSNNQLLSTIEGIVAVCIAGPIFSHYTTAKFCLSLKKHVFVEKPLCTSKDELRDLFQLAQNNNCHIVSNYNLLQAKAFKYLAHEFSKNTTSIHKIEFNRLNTGGYKENNDVLWDLFVHDLALFATLFLSDEVLEVKLISKQKNNQQKIVAAEVAIYLHSGITAHFNFSWQSAKVNRSLNAHTKQGVLRWVQEKNMDKISLNDKVLATIHNDNNVKNSIENFVLQIQENTPNYNWHFKLNQKINQCIQTILAHQD